MSEPTKTCGVCTVPLPLSQFYVCPTSADGRAGICIQCQKDKVYEMRQRRVEAGLTVKGEIPKVPKWRLQAQQKLAEEGEGSTSKSERAIERERQTRREEKEIELELQPEPDESEFTRSGSPWAGLIPVRQGRVAQRVWEIR